jgi:hypothetical protein
MELDLQKFIWAPCAQSLAEAPQLPLSPRLWAHILYYGAYGQPRQTTSFCDEVKIQKEVISDLKREMRYESPMIDI